MANLNKSAQSGNNARNDNWFQIIEPTTGCSGHCLDWTGLDLSLSRSAGMANQCSKGAKLAVIIIVGYISHSTTTNYAQLFSPLFLRICLLVAEGNKDLYYDSRGILSYKGFSPGTIQILCRNGSRIFKCLIRV